MYGNYRNYYLDYRNRQAAQNNFMDAMESGRRAQQASAEYDRNAMAAPGFMGSRSPTSSVGHMAHNHAGRFWQQNENQYANMGNMAMQNAMNNEMAQAQDRAADFYENQMASKNRSDAMAHDLGRRGIDSNERIAMANNRSLSDLAGNMNLQLGEIGQQMPTTSLYDNDGEKIGGTFGKGKGSLFEKTGIKKSLMS